MNCKFLFPVLLCVFFFSSCETENAATIPSENELAEMNSFTNSKIAIEENGALKLIVSENSVLKSAVKFSKKNGKESIPKEFAIQTINNKKYLRIYNDNNTVSTVALNLDPTTNSYTTGGTVCETTACASGGGCVPDGDYCTPCTIGPGNLPGDCKRITTKDFEVAP